MGMSSIVSTPGRALITRGIAFTTMAAVARGGVGIIALIVWAMARKR